MLQVACPVYQWIRQDLVAPKYANKTRDKKRNKIRDNERKMDNAITYQAFWSSFSQSVFDLEAQSFYGVVVQTYW